MSSPGQAGPGQRLVDTAVARIRAEGLTVSLEHLGLEWMIAEAGVSRATAYRHWPTKAAFLSEVLLTVGRTTHLEGETPAEVAGLLKLIADSSGTRRPDGGLRDGAGWLG